MDGFTPIPHEPVVLDEGILKGEATAAKLENATLKFVLPYNTIHTLRY